MKFFRFAPFAGLFAGVLILPLPTRGDVVLWSANPTADAFVTTGPSSNLLGNNFGGAGVLAISGNAASNGQFDSVIRFDFSDAKTQFDTDFGAGQWTVQSVTLNLTTFATPTRSPTFNSNATGNFSVTLLTTNSWTEGAGKPTNSAVAGINFTTLQGLVTGGDESLGAFLFDTNVSGADNSVTTLNLTVSSGLFADILSGGQASLHLFATDPAMSYLFNSRSINTGGYPLLTVTPAFAPVPEPAAILMIFPSAALAAALAHRRRLKD